MNEYYYKTITGLEQDKVSRQYITGWASGFLGNPEVEEQRLTDAWRAGYDDGKEKNTDHSSDWKDGEADGAA